MHENLDRLFENLRLARARNAFTRGVSAWIDEAGYKGLMHRLRVEDDAKIGLMCALAAPIERIDEVRAKLRLPFAHFEDQFGKSTKAHITDAFVSRDRRPILERVRNELFEVVSALGLPILYEAARLGIVRRTFSSEQQMQQTIRANQDARYAFPNQLDGDRVEVRLASGLIRKLDVFAYWVGADHLDVLFDRMDAAILNDINDQIETLNSPRRRVVAKGWDKEERAPVKREVVPHIERRCSADLPRAALRHHS
jgi:hypothetical protein